MLWTTASEVKEWGSVVVVAHGAMLFFSREEWWVLSFYLVSIRLEVTSVLKNPGTVL